MKQIRAFLARKGALPALCWALAVLAWLVLAAAHLALDTAARRSGALQEQTLGAAQFQLVDLSVVQGEPLPENEAAATVLRTLSGDPQMILEPVAGGVLAGDTVRSMRVYCTFNADPREMCLYYTTAADQPYSQDRRVFPVRQADGSYLYTLPRARLYALRLDPCSPDANKTVDITMEKIVLNQPQSAAGYFLPSWYQLFCLILYPALAAAALSLLAQAARRR